MEFRPRDCCKFALPFLASGIQMLIFWGFQNAARQLYGHIDNLELYPGLQAEDCMPLGPGSGICCGYTMTRAILGDAIALVRGDRFFTHDYTRKLSSHSSSFSSDQPPSVYSCKPHHLGFPRLCS